MFLFFLAGSSRQQHPNISELEELAAAVPRGPRSSIPGGCSRDHPGPRDTRAKAGRCWCGLVCGGCCAVPLARRDPLCQPAAGGRGRGHRQSPCPSWLTELLASFFLPAVSLPNLKPAVPRISTSGGPYPPQHGFCGLEKEMG